MEKIKEFYRLADSYCRFITSGVIAKDNISALMELLMELYASASNLPEKEPETTDPISAEHIGATPITFNEQIPKLYWEVFDPFVCENAVCSDLSEDLSEIAADLKNGMKEFEAGRIGNIFHFFLTLQMEVNGS